MSGQVIERYGAVRPSALGSSIVGRPYAPGVSRAVSGGIDLSYLLRAPVQQAHEDCTAHAMVFLADAVRRRDGHSDVGLLSRYYTWQMQQGRLTARFKEDKVRDHGFGWMADAAAALVGGVPPETQWPYDSGHYMREPTTLATFLGQRYKCTGVEWLEARDKAGNYDVTTMRDALDHHKPFAFSIAIRNHFKLDSGNIYGTPTVAQIAQSSNTAVAHAVVCYGYHGDFFDCLNTSWGAGFGDRGKFHIHADQMANPLLTFDHLILSGFTA